jgi:hypothetical protein
MRDKIGRNQPCPCGSGKKYKKCCGDLRARESPSRQLDPQVDRRIQQKLREIEAENIQREKQQGLGKSIVAVEFHDHRFVAVGNKLYWSKKWKTFQDFLRDHVINQLGCEWFRGEIAKPEHRQHPIARWFEQSIADLKRLGKQEGEITTGPMTGAQSAFLNLAYNLYLIAHHADPEESGQLIATILERLKSGRSDDFIGKLFETYAAATFLKAGFKLSYENESNGKTSHVEFVATYPSTGKKFSVEVKARNRATSENGLADDVKRLRVASKLNKALAKAAEHARVVMIEVNVPDMVTGKSIAGWPQAALEQIRYAEQNPPTETAMPSAYVIVTNHAFHNNLATIGSGAAVLATGYRIPDFGPGDGFCRFKDYLAWKERHKEMLALLESMKTHYEIPSTFDGEIPEFAFNGSSKLSRLRFGQSYLIRKPDGSEILGRLYEATVWEQKKLVCGAYEISDGQHILATCPLTDEEFAAWRRYPDTFFGEVRRVGKKIENRLELCEFFYETYKNTPRERLLEWMKDAADIEDLGKLSQEELAVAYCERLGSAVPQSPQAS